MSAGNILFNRPLAASRGESEKLMKIIHGSMIDIVEVDSDKEVESVEKKLYNLGYRKYLDYPDIKTYRCPRKADTMVTLIS